jgi:hypothetical protein
VLQNLSAQFGAGGHQFRGQIPKQQFSSPSAGSTRELFFHGTAVGRSSGAIFKLTGDLLNIAAAAAFSTVAYKKFIARQIHAPNKRRFCVNSIILLLFLCASAGWVKNTR